MRTPTLIRKKVTSRISGIPSFDSIQAEECWDIYTSDERSKYTVVRHSFRTIFHKKPTFFASTIEQRMVNFQQENYSNWVTWAKNCNISEIENNKK